jgi:hypothetical protein
METVFRPGTTRCGRDERATDVPIPLRLASGRIDRELIFRKSPAHVSSEKRLCQALRLRQYNHLVFHHELSLSPPHQSIRFLTMRFLVACDSSLPCYNGRKSCVKESEVEDRTAKCGQRALRRLLVLMLYASANI